MTKNGEQVGKMINNVQKQMFFELITRDFGHFRCFCAVLVSKISGLRVVGTRAVQPIRIQSALKSDSDEIIRIKVGFGFQTFGSDWIRILPSHPIRFEN